MHVRKIRNWYKKINLIKPFNNNINNNRQIRVKMHIKFKKMMKKQVIIEKMSKKNKKSKIQKFKKK
jgi:hypothetical protein